MDESELRQYISRLSDADKIKLVGLSQLSLDKLDELIKLAPTEDKKKFVIVARYINLAESINIVPKAKP